MTTKVLNTAELSNTKINAYTQQAPLIIGDELTLIDVVESDFQGNQYFNFVFDRNGLDRKISAGALCRRHANMTEGAYNNNFYKAIDKLIEADELSVKALAEIINGHTLVVTNIEKLPDSEGRAKSFFAYDIK